MEAKGGITYKTAGVDVKAGYKAVSLMKDHVKRTFTKGVLSDIGGFGGLFALDKEAYKEPVLVSGTDGVGTKLKLAFMMDKHDTIGEDCVAMCVNDILCQGAKPLFFLDYIATGKLMPEKIEKIVSGIANGCIKGGCALIGGETAEMPGLYKDEEYDLAGFSVGIVDKPKIIDGSTISEGDALISLPSSGLHSNGFSLVRKLFFDLLRYDVDQYIPEVKSTLGEELIKPTRIYATPILDLIDRFDVKGVSHITGGGFYENIPRMMPAGFTPVIDINKLAIPPIFQLIKNLGDISDREMFSTFNMGTGIVIAVNSCDADGVIRHLKSNGEEASIVGEIKKGEGGLILCHQ